MRGQNYTSVVNHKSKTIVPWIRLEVSRVGYIIIPLIAFGISAIVLSIFIPELVYVWILFAMIAGLGTTIALNLEDEKEQQNLLRTYYYKYIRKYTHIRTTDGQIKVMRRIGVHPYYKRLKRKKGGILCRK